MIPYKDLNEIPSPIDYRVAFEESIKKFRDDMNKRKQNMQIPENQTWFNKLKQQLPGTQREKVIGPLVMAYKQPAKIVENGGNLT